MSDTPGGFLPISDSMARDLDNGRADHRTIEDFIPDTVLQEYKDQQDRQSVVHAEDLRPISKAEAARRTTFDGEHMPQIPATRRVIPAPFKRDRIVGGSHGKSWRDLKGGDIRKGDIITGVGLVVDIISGMRYDTVAGKRVPVAEAVKVTGPAGYTQTFDVTQDVRLFR